MSNEVATEQKTEQYTEGYNAFVENNAMIDDCPYKDSTQQYADWIDGWTTAIYDMVENLGKI